MIQYETPLSEIHKSKRQEQLSQQVRDVLAYAFANEISASDIFQIPMTAAEVRIGNGDLDRVMLGGGFYRHGGNDSMKYFVHANNETWAVVFSHDCDGDAERGKAIIDGYSPKEVTK